MIKKHEEIILSGNIKIIYGPLKIIGMDGMVFMSLLILKFKIIFTGVIIVLMKNLHLLIILKIILQLL